MSNVVYAKFIYNGRINTIALIEGIDTQELHSLMCNVFGITGSIVGVIAEKGLVIPMSLLCKFPQVVPDGVCKILVSGAQQEVSSASARRNSATRSVDSGAASEAIESSVAASGADEEEEEELDESVQQVIEEISRFLNALNSQNFLNPRQHDVLQRLLQKNSTLLFAAYSVALSANDSEYLAEIVKEIANSLLSGEQGRSACEAQDEVLQVCDQLYLNERITENQLLYLRHLVLIREESVATAYDEYQEHQSVTMLAKSLFNIANEHPFQQTEKDSGRDSDVVPSVDEDRGSDAEDETDASEKGDLSIGARKKILSGVAALMSRAGVLSKTETAVLFELIEEQNDYVLAACELFERDRNLDELQDTLLRCVRLEVRKRVIDIQDKELESMQRERELQIMQAEAEADEVVEDESERDADRIVDSEEDSDDTDNSDDEYGLEDISLTTLLQSLNINPSRWENKVPQLFLQTLCIAAIRGELQRDQVNILCDLFYAQYDLVTAAWEVFQVQRDRLDFIDTLRRIVRDVDNEVYEDDEEDAKDQTADSSKSGTSGSSTASVASSKSLTDSLSDSPSMKAGAGSAASTLSSVGSIPSSPQNRDIPAETRDARAAAVQAVQEAKTELLSQSLSMLVKHGMVAESQADALLVRYTRDRDVLVEAAIESFSRDRNLKDFLETLQILCMKSKEEIEALMNESEEPEQEITRPDIDSTDRDTIVLMQVTDIVKEMLKSDLIGPAVAEVFQRLISNRDKGLLSAYEKYLQKKDGAQLVDDLLRVVIASVEGVPASSTTAAKATPPPATSSQKASSPSKPSPKEEKKSDDSEQEESILDGNDMKKIVEILYRSRAISLEQCESLSKRIDKGDRALSQIFSAYEKDKNVYNLMEKLRTVADTASGPTKSSPSKPAVLASNESRDADDESDDADEDEIESKFLEVVQTMKLSDLETAALRLAIAENDVNVKNAIEAFRGDRDSNKLSDRLRAAAHAVIQRTLSSRQFAANQEDGDDDIEDDGEEDDENNDDNEDDDDDDDDDDDEEDAEDDEDDDEDQNFSGRSLITPQSARDSVFPILVNELIKESILPLGAGEKLLDEFSRGSAVIGAALDVYDQDNDMAKLVDTLQTIVEDQ